MYIFCRSVIAPTKKLTQESPIVSLFLWGYFSCVLVGWLILQLPLCQKSFVRGLDTFFTAASAVSTTGLATVDIGKTFSFLGQLVLLLLIQLGGIGYMIFSSSIVLSLEQKMLNFRRKNPLDASSLSRGFTIIGLIKQIVAYTVICEISGSVVLYFFFRNEGVESSLWNAIFHSVSAFCTAGFSLFSSNLEGYQNHFGINAAISFLSLLGAFGFFLWINFFKRIIDRKGYIRFVARITRSFATATILIGTFLFLPMIPFTTESSEFQMLITSCFQIVSTITTAGFNTIDIRTLSQITHLFLIILMLFGVSLTGSVTNMRGTSFAALLRLMINMLSKKKTPSCWNQKILLKRLQIAISTFSHYLLILLISGLLIILIEKQPFLPLLFETASALCTVGLSMGITTELSIHGKSLIILLMLIGRVGILIFGFAIANQKLSWKHEKLQEQAF